jgi:hypothetical protein
MMIPGWPSCSKEGCPWPAFFKIRMEGDAGPFLAHLCIFCVGEIRECLAALSRLSAEERQILDQVSPPAFEKADIHRIDAPEDTP